MRRTVSSALLVAAADIAVLFPFLRLVPLLVHDASTVGTKEQAGKQAHLIIAVRAFALFPQLLHALPGYLVNDGLMRVFKDSLFLFRVVDDLMHLVRLHGGFKIYKASGIFLTFKDMRDRICRPSAFIARMVAACIPSPVVFQRARCRDPLFRQHARDFRRPIPCKAQAVYLLHHRCGFLINYEFLIPSHQVSVYRVARDRLPAHAF